MKQIETAAEREKAMRPQWVQRENEYIAYWHEHEIGRVGVSQFDNFQTYFMNEPLEGKNRNLSVAKIKVEAELERFIYQVMKYLELDFKTFINKHSNDKPKSFM